MNGINRPIIDSSNKINDINSIIGINNNYVDSGLFNSTICQKLNCLLGVSNGLRCVASDDEEDIIFSKIGEFYVNDYSVNVGVCTITPKGSGTIKVEAELKGDGGYYSELICSIGSTSNTITVFKENSYSYNKKSAVIAVTKDVPLTFYFARLSGGKFRNFCVKCKYILK
ncbi:MAG: hypothetical protein K2F59_00875 [Eubacteriales bacterium]|nr:hypothetical protein [Eubacteriales bacterium]